MKINTYSEINQEVLRTLFRPGNTYYLLLAICVTAILFGAFCWSYQISTGIGAAGLMHPVMWGIYLVNFVFWIGIAHSGTLISAILYLFRATWRTAIARSAEAMTVFAVMIAGLFPIIHLGRVWIFYWLIPYPNPMNLWPNFQSPLVFDFVAVTTYLTVSSLFWFTGLLPDLAIVRDHTRGLRQKIYGIFSLGWVGSQHQWHHYGWSYLLLAALATPLVISVHSVVSWDFALSIIPGYHSTIFAPYFVAGAIHSGLAMVLTLLIPLRRIFRFENLITMDTLEKIAKTMIFTALVIGYAYLVEYFMAWYSGNVFEQDAYLWRAIGNYAPLFWMMILFNAVLPLTFFFKKVRTHHKSLFIIAILVNIGMWFERFVIIIGSMAHDYDPYVWGLYSPSWVEVGIMVGSFGLFFTFFLLFVKFLPSISITEIKEEFRPPKRMDGLLSSAPHADIDSKLRREGPMNRRQQTHKGAFSMAGIFSDFDDVIATVKILKGKKIHVETVLSPLPRPEVQEALSLKPSPVRHYTFLGGVLGVVALLGLATYAHLQWNLVTSGKPILAWIPFIIIAFEGCILLAVLATFIGMIIKGRMPRSRLPNYYDPRFTQDRFGLLVFCKETEEEEVTKLLKDSGAEEVKRVEG